MSITAETAPLTAALTCANGWGITVAPCRPDTKKPWCNRGEGWDDVSSADDATIRANFAARSGAGVCLLTGKQSDLWILDIDGEIGMNSMRHLIAKHAGGEMLPETVVVRTPRGGLHYWFKWADGDIDIPTRAGQIGTGIDVRGTRGIAVAPPTNGRAFVKGRELGEDVDILPAPEWLLELVKYRPPVARAADAAPTDEPEWARRYNAEHTWAELLEADGWQLKLVSQNGDHQWTRPGKNLREGSSATVANDGKDKLRMWSGSLPWLPSDDNYTKWAYHVYRHHAGDFKAARRAHDAGSQSPSDIVSGINHRGRAGRIHASASPAAT